MKFVERHFPSCYPSYGDDLQLCRVAYPFKIFPILLKKARKSEIGYFIMKHGLRQLQHVQPAAHGLHVAQSKVLCGPVWVFAAVKVAYPIY